MFNGIAAVAVSLPTGKTVAAVHVRVNAAAISCFHVGYSIANCRDFQTQFVAEHARLTDERHFAKISADVGAVDTHQQNFRSHEYCQSRIGILRIDEDRPCI